MLASIDEQKEQFGLSDIGKNKKVMVGFVSANPTGPLSVGHGRNAILGDTIARLLVATGHAVTREYYFNNAGRQMRVLGASLQARYLEKLGLDNEFPEDGYQGDYIYEIAKDMKEETMLPHTINIMNAIADEGLELFDEHYDLNADRDKAQGLLVRSSPVDLADFPDIVTIARAGAGVNNIPVDEASDKGICVFNTPGANANAVVELIFTMLGISLRNIHKGLAFCEGLSGSDNDSLNAEVEARKKQFKGMEMAGKTLGVIGLGQIGVRVANMGVYHNMRVIGYDPFPVMDNIHGLLPDVELAKARRDLLAQSDFVSLHVPLNRNTEGLVSKEFIAFMKKDALLFNYARGPVVDEDVVLEAIDTGRIAGHVSDFPSAKLIGHDKVLLTPHLGASTAESEENCACMAVRELKSYLEYGNITHSVNFPNVESIPTVWVHTRLIVINKDTPGMIGMVSNILGRHGINIMSYTNKSNGTLGYNIIDAESAVSPEVRKEIEAVDGVIRTRVIPLKNGSDAD